MSVPIWLLGHGFLGKDYGIMELGVHNIGGLVYRI
jgi:hypothetical protein